MLGSRGGEDGADTVGRAVGEEPLGSIRGGEGGAVSDSEEGITGSTELIFLMVGFSTGVTTDGGVVAIGGSAAIGGVKARGGATGADASRKVSWKSGIVMTPGSV